ncbi:hypothetical protein CHS0354_032643 [Potamilus streckersoni]|uniref:NADPH-dependent FMN reductase-like domain-containing protein n=1 Tax=Potamilus streckersoni TaxID=2493646 RepID=A0AAE0VUX5_9BIVA|nr:hypothetical protein CHS0354_032643 [Potamilus streckersoni]
MYRAYVRQLAMSKKEAKLKVVVFLGSTREGRMGDRVAKFVTKYLESTNHDVHLIDPVQLKLPLLEKPLFFYPDQSKAPKVLQETDKLIQDADAFVVVSCEYNHSIPPALANTLDHFAPPHFAWRPSGIVTYSPGQFGGMRCAMQLRCMLGELGCLSVSNIFGIPKVHEALDEEGKPLNDYMKTGINTLVTQLDWHATAMKRQREAVGVPPPPKPV